MCRLGIYLLSAVGPTPAARKMVSRGRGIFAISPACRRRRRIAHQPADPSSSITWSI